MTSTIDSHRELASRISRSAESAPLSANDIAVVQVAAHGWRASDARLPKDHPHRLLGFIEERGGEFEVMQLGHGFHWCTFESMDDAIAHLLHTAPQTTTDRLSGDLSWIV